jgi:hypothetical protein
MSSQERDILMVMRKVLTSVIREITPAPGAPSPLSERTIEDVRDCLKLISLRERELADELGIAMERPYYKDEPQTVQSVSVSDIGKNLSDKEE